MAFAIGFQMHIPPYINGFAFESFTNGLAAPKACSRPVGSSNAIVASRWFQLAFGDLRAERATIQSTWV